MVCPGRVTVLPVLVAPRGTETTAGTMIEDVLGLFAEGAWLAITLTRFALTGCRLCRSWSRLGSVEQAASSRRHICGCVKVETAVP